MQFLQIDANTKLHDMIKLIGHENTAQILASNNLSWNPKVGKKFDDMCSHIVSTAPEVTIQKRVSILNTFTSDSDLFEMAALMDSNSWKVMSNLGSFPNTLRVPSTVHIPESVNTLGNNQSVKPVVYHKAMAMMSAPPYVVDPSIFNEYSTLNVHTSEYNANLQSNSDPFTMFRFPWGDITLHSSLYNESMDFPVYPEELSDGVKANYTTMPDMIFQYEPWQIYTGSGPRSVPLTFHIHRDMWTGDHRDGKCNELIRFCEANCYPEYNGSAVNTSTVTLYIKGRPLISGIMTDVSTEWSGPIGLDGFYLDCQLKISITEVATSALNYSVVKSKRIIG